MRRPWLACVALACSPTVETPDADATGTSEGPTGGGPTDESASEGDTADPTSITATAPTSADGSSSDTDDTDEPLPPSGLGPWGYSFEVLDDIEAAEVVLADFDGDAHVDVFVQGPLAGTDATLRLYSGAGDGVGFTAGSASVVAWWERPIAGDFDGDGNLDVVAVDSSYDDVFYAALNVGGAFPQSIQNIGEGLFTGFGTAPIDVDGDGMQDLFIAGGHSMGGFVYTSTGAGAFAFDYAVAGP
ncbi:MAG TPA: VCBS repeat-containing protein, partial [Nannocystaceae bacterium]|nr:VCBS repeat-containing protein [Nannocystaceae bacterium]